MKEEEQFISKHRIIDRFRYNEDWSKNKDTDFFSVGQIKRIIDSIIPDPVIPVDMSHKQEWKGKYYCECCGERTGIKFVFCQHCGSKFDEGIW